MACDGPPPLEMSVGPTEADVTKIIRTIRPIWGGNPLKVKRLGGSRHVTWCCHQEVDAELLEACVVKEHQGATQETLYMHLAGQNRAAPMVFCALDNGLIYQYIQGRELSKEDIANDKAIKSTMRALGQLHSIAEEEITNVLGPDPEVRKDFIASRMKCFLSDIKEAMNDSAAKASYESAGLPCLDALSSEVERVASLLLECGEPMVLSHGDLCLSNIIFNEEYNMARLIDFDSAGFTFAPFDLARLLISFHIENGGSALTEDTIRAWVEAYVANREGIEAEKTISLTKAFITVQKLYCGLWFLSEVLKGQKNRTQESLENHKSQAVTYITEYMSEKDTLQL